VVALNEVGFMNPVGVATVFELNIQEERDLWV